VVLLDHVLDDVAAALCKAATVADACQLAVDAVARHTPAIIAVLLHVHDHLRCVAAVGSWQVFSAVPLERGVAGRVYASGRTATLTNVAADPDYISLGPDVAVEICAPIPRSLGALNVEWTTQVDITTWRPLVEEVARRVGDRITELGGAPVESSSEQMLRHALSFSTAGDELELLNRSLAAAREVSGLSTAAVLLPGRSGARVHLGNGRPTPLGDKVAGIDPGELSRLVARARRYGAGYSIGDPTSLDAQGFEPLTDIGVRTMITVPVGADPDRGTGGMLLVVDERVSRPEAATVALLSLLAAQAWSSLDRLRTLRRLREKASCDPLTGLRHYGPFAERLAQAVPGRTAVLAIDIDRFKHINDTYGHQAGDQALVDLARTLENALRSGDDLYRVGGDEFAAVIEVQRSDEAIRVAERLVAAARRIGRTISVGVAVQPRGELAEDTLRRADVALYEAKRTGRDGVRVALLRRVRDVA
jgi:diguanylate cyclase (GGDEF)-like protein